MRTPAVTLALLIILALGFGTAAMADGSNASPAARTTSTAHTNPSTPAPQGNAYGTTKPKPAGDDNGATTTTGDPGTDTTPTGDAGVPTDLPPAAAPVLDRSAAVAPVSGDVQVKLPGGAYVPLSAGASIPMGATVDASGGAVELTSAHDASGTPQSATFRGGICKLESQSKGATPVTNLRLTDGNFTAACGRAALSFAKRPPVRELWGSGHGNFKTVGRYSAATVRGTIWLTRDTCDGTLTIVKRGVVAVRDNVHRITVLVHAGHSYFAQAPIPTGAATSLSGF